MSTVRYYPEEEGYRDSKGIPYPLIPENQVRSEMLNWINKFIEECHNQGWWFIPTSYNSGRHTSESMHYRGLAADFNCKHANGDYVDFKTQADIAAKVATELGYDCWLWVSDLNTHTHISLHPANASPEENNTNA